MDEFFTASRGELKLSLAADREVYFTLQPAAARK